MLYKSYLSFFLDDDTTYDRSKYNEFLLRAAESILLPFGYTKERLDGLMHNRGLQMDLGRWQS